MGKRCHHEMTGPLSPSNQALVVHQVNEVLPQSTPLDPQPNPTIFTPPSRSPSPLSLSPRESTPTPADSDHLQDPDLLESQSDCSESSRSSQESLSAMNVSKVRDNLASKRFFYEDEKALQRGGQVILDEALKIMTSKRHSPTGKDNAPLLKDAIKKFSSSTERTLVHNVWCILKGKARDVVDKALPEDDNKAMEWVKRAWDQDYLECVFESNLTKECIPDTSYTGNSTTDKLFALLPRIEQPRPDVTYGLWKQDISATIRTILDTYHCDLAKGLYLPFLIVEVKTQDAIQGEAENQCIRGGASLVNTIHQWNRVAAGKKHFKDMTPTDKQDERNEFAAAAEKAKQDHGTIQSRADLKSFAFSLALSPPSATMHVHWREVWEDGVEDWHAHAVATYPLRLQLEHYENLQTHITNIMDWGCITRRMEIEKQAKVIGKRQWELDEDDIDFTSTKRQRLI